jgi:N-acetylglucosamine-6-phosphate deacetylase
MREGSSILVRNARVLSGESGWLEGASVAIENGAVTAVGAKAASPAGAVVLDAAGLWAVPGWIDLQVNDIGWLSGGLREPGEHAGRIREVLEYQGSTGVTGCVLATLAAPLDEILAYLGGMKKILGDGNGRAGILLGGLVEGTFMNPEFHGAHNPDWVLPPDPGVLDQLLATGAVSMINIAPETTPAAISLVAEAVGRGVVVGCGHAKPHAECLREAVAAGLGYLIHLGNGPTGSSLKVFNDGGLLEESLRNDDLVATFIVDGYHVHPQLLRDWISRKEISRCIGISDAGFGTGAPTGPFELCGIKGEPAEGGAYLRVVRSAEERELAERTSDAGALFGAAIGMREVFENLVNLFSVEMQGVHVRSHPALSLEDSVAAASRMCSSNPAELLGIEDRGSLASGGRGDVVLLEISGKPGSLQVRVRETLVGGQAPGS